MSFKSDLFIAMRIHSDGLPHPSRLAKPSRMTQTCAKTKSGPVLPYWQSLMGALWKERLKIMLAVVVMTEGESQLCLGLEGEARVRFPSKSN